MDVVILYGVSYHKENLSVVGFSAISNYET